MSFLDLLLGRRLSTAEAENERVKPWSGVSILGLDALGSAAYGPEAALTILLPAGALGPAAIPGVLGGIIVLLAILYFSYRQTIAAYPGGGGAYIVAKENLGTKPGLLAAAALLVDYMLNVAVGISAGIGALESAFPALQKVTLEACLFVLLIITLVNLRGVRQTGKLWLIPTALFIATLFLVILAGVAKAFLSGGNPAPIEPPPPVPAATVPVTAWLLIRAFASGCTAMTGVEAVSNAVPIFRKPQVKNAQMTLTIICLVLAGLLAGIGYLSKAYGIAARDQRLEGYESILSQLAAAAVGHGFLYYLCIGSVLAVLALSANTSFSDFPRLCRLLAEDGFLPPSFANLGRRLVYTDGILLLATVAGVLLFVFGGLTEPLIPLFAVGAFSAFTFSQAGMMSYWRKKGVFSAPGSLFLNATGAAATALALVAIIVTKFTEGAWMTLFLVLGLAALFTGIGRHYGRIRSELAAPQPLEIPPPRPLLAVVPISGWDRLGETALRIALRLSPEVVAVNVSSDPAAAERLRARWREIVERPAADAGLPPPRLEIIPSPFRLVFQPLVDFVLRTKAEHPGRIIVVVIPELVQARWWEYLLHNYSVAAFKTFLLIAGGERVVILNTGWRLKEEPPNES